jgi:hypothetical protein
MILTLVVEDNLLKYITGKDEPSTIWEILKKGIKNESKTTFLQNRLYTMKMESKETPWKNSLMVLKIS